MRYALQYDQFHPDDAEHRQGIVDWLQQRLQAAVPDIATKQRGLDIGCAHGCGMEAMQAAGVSAVSGVEIDAEQAAPALARGLSVAVVADTTAWLAEQPTDHFDLIIMIDVLEHVPRDAIAAMLAQLFRCLAPGGHVVVQVPNLASPVGAYLFAADATHRTPFTHRSLMHVLASAGFVNHQIIPEYAEGLRPSFRIWSRNARRTWRQWRRYLLRKWWRALLVSELYHGERPRDIPCDPNLMVVAESPPAA